MLIIFLDIYLPLVYNASIERNEKRKEMYSMSVLLDLSVNSEGKTPRPRFTPPKIEPFLNHYTTDTSVFSKDLLLSVEEGRSHEKF